MIENVHTAVARVKAAGPKKANRTLVVNEFMRGSANPKSSDGKALMQKRALFITLLREQEVWP